MTQIELHTKCIRQLERISYNELQIQHFERRIDIEEAKDSIYRYMLFPRAWLNEEIEKCQYRISIRRAIYERTLNQLKSC